MVISGPALPLAESEYQIQMKLKQPELWVSGPKSSSGAGNMPLASAGPAHEGERTRAQTVRITSFLPAALLVGDLMLFTPQ